MWFNIIVTFKLGAHSAVGITLLLLLHVAGPHSLWHGRSIQGTRLHVYTSCHNPCSCTPLSYFVNRLPHT